MKRVYVVALLTIFVSIIQVDGKGIKSEEKTKQLLIQIERDLENASMNLNPAPYDRYWADDFVAIMNEGFNPNAKAEHRAALTGGKIKFKSFEVDGIDARVFGNAAILVSHRKVKFQFDGREISLNNIVTSFFSKRKGAWQKIAEQTVHLPQ